MRKLKLLMKYLPYLHRILWFNFHYLPLKQAFKLPILLYKPRLMKCSGDIQINGPISTGMIKMGQMLVSVYPNSGIVWECNGSVTFNGKCDIGNNSYISVGKTGRIEFGRDFIATTTFRAIAYKCLHFGDNALIGWDNLFCDTDFHVAQNAETGKKVGGVCADINRIQ